MKSRYIDYLNNINNTSWKLYFWNEEDLNLYMSIFECLYWFKFNVDSRWSVYIYYHLKIDFKATKRLFWYWSFWYSLCTYMWQGKNGFVNCHWEMLGLILFIRYFLMKRENNERLNSTGIVPFFVYTTKIIIFWFKYLSF